MAMWRGSKTPDVQRLKTTYDIDGLKNALCFPKSSDVRAAAAWALAWIASDRPSLAGPALDALALGLADVNESVRSQVVLALGRNLGAAAIDLLHRALGDSSPEVRREAVRTLYTHDDVATVPALRTAAGDESVDVRLAAVNVLAGLSKTDATIDALAFALADTAPEVRAAAVAALTGPAAQSVQGSLLAMLADSVPALRVSAVRALASMPSLDASTISALAAALGDESEDMRMTVIDALAGSEHSGAVDALCQALSSDESAAVRKKAARALAAQPRAVRTLTAAALFDSDHSVRLASTRSLGAIHGWDEAVIRAFVTSERAVRDEKVVDALVDTSDVATALPAVLGHSDNTLIAMAARVLDALGQPYDQQAAAAALSRVLRGSADPEERRAAARQLAATEAGLEVLQEALTDESHDVRVAAAERLQRRETELTLTREQQLAYAHALRRIDALAQMGSDAVPFLTELLRGEGEMSSTIADVANALGRMRDARSGEALAWALINRKDLPDSTRHAVVTALGDMRETAAIAALGPLAEDTRESASLREAAIVALVAIGGPSTDTLVRALISLAQVYKDSAMRLGVVKADIAALVDKALVALTAGPDRDPASPRLLISLAEILGKAGLRPSWGVLVSALKRLTGEAAVSHIVAHIAGGRTGTNVLAAVLCEIGDRSTIAPLRAVVEREAEPARYGEVWSADALLGAMTVTACLGDERDLVRAIEIVATYPWHDTRDAYVPQVQSLTDTIITRFDRVGADLADDDLVRIAGTKDLSWRWATYETLYYGDLPEPPMPAVTHHGRLDFARLRERARLELARRKGGVA